MSRWSLPILITLIALPLPRAHAEPWSVKLGFPPGRRVIILDAGDMGVAWEQNDAGTELMQNGCVSSASVVVVGPWIEDFANWCRQRPDADIGVSIALTKPYQAISWRLLSSDMAPTTLVDADGCPWRNVVQLALNAQVADVQRELDAQIARARALGIPVSHISSYYGTMFCRADLAELLLAASQKYWLPSPVVDVTPELIDRFRRQGYPIDERLIELVGSYPLPKLDDLQILPAGDTYEATRDQICSLLAALQPGLTQLVCRPAVESNGLKRMTPDWQQRVWTAQVLADEQFRQTLADQQIIVTNWRAVMQRFERPELLSTDSPGDVPKTHEE